MAPRSRSASLGLLVALAVVALGFTASAGAQSGPQPGIADPFIDTTPQAPATGLRAGAPAIRSLKGHRGEALVDDDGVECPDAGFTTIQAAVDSGAKNIRVCAGVYPENVSIPSGSDVKLRGDGAGSTIVQGVAGTTGPIIDVAPLSKVDIAKLTVDGGSAMATGTDYGILYTDADGKVKEVEVANIRNPAGNAQGIGIAVKSVVGTSKVQVEKSTVFNYTRVGIYGSGAGTDIDVSKNVVTGPVLPRVWAPNGIQISRWAEGKVEDNMIDNNPSPNPPGGGGSGVILLCPGKTEVKKNHVSEADLGISLAETGNAKVEHNTITDSVFDGISLQFLGLVYGVDLGCGIGDSPTAGNDIKGNTIRDAADTGISTIDYHAYYALAPVLGPEMMSKNRLHDNDISDSGGDGIHLWSGIDNKLEKNDIEGSVGTDAVDDTTGDGTAGTANEWKKNKCDTSSPDGLCKH